jgi:glutamate synthase (NADPH/NADH) large chain
VHSRYSTNTFPSWPLAQPFRMIAHNGEINTVQGNRNWMRARQSQLESELLGDLRPLFPIVSEGASDSASFDEVVELLTLGGRSLPHAIMMMVPEAGRTRSTSTRPAARSTSSTRCSWSRGTAPPRWSSPTARSSARRSTATGCVPDGSSSPTTGLVVLASEIGVLDFPPDRIVRKGRLRPGKMFLVDTAEGRIVEDDEIKAELAASQPWQDWLDEGRIHLADLPEREHITPHPASVERRQRTFGYTEEEVRILVSPDGAERRRAARGPMGSDTPIAC